MKWPNTTDGDVFRRLDQTEFDFTQKYWIDFNVDFKIWPPDEKTIDALKMHYRQVVIVEPEDDFNGYIEVKIYSYLTYDFVIEQQEKLSRLMLNARGCCESWGVLHE